MKEKIKQEVLKAIPIGKTFKSKEWNELLIDLAIQKTAKLIFWQIEIMAGLGLLNKGDRFTISKKDFFEFKKEWIKNEMQIL